MNQNNKIMENKVFSQLFVRSAKIKLLKPKLICVRCSGMGTVYKIEC